MRHRKDGRQFSRNTSHRRAMFRNLAANLVNHERIVTTDAKAKELRRVAEKLITRAKRLGKVAYTPQAELSAEDKARRLHVSRLLAAFLPRWGVQSNGTKRDLVDKVMIDLSKRFAERKGGYTRIIKLGARKGDGAAMSLIEFVDAQPVVAPEEPEEAAEAAQPEETEPEETEPEKTEPEAATPEAAASEAATPEEASSEESKDEE